jgi:predicted glycosyltransferase
MFSDDGAQLKSCPVCNQPKTEKKVTKIVYIGDRTAEMLAFDELRDNLIQRQREFTTENNKTHVDIYYDNVFRHLYSSQAISN